MSASPNAQRPMTYHFVKWPSAAVACISTWIHVPAADGHLTKWYVMWPSAAGTWLQVEMHATAADGVQGRDELGEAEAGCKPRERPRAREIVPCRIPERIGVADRRQAALRHRQAAARQLERMEADRVGRRLCGRGRSDGGDQRQRGDGEHAANHHAIVRLPSRRVNLP